MSTFQTSKKWPNFPSTQPKKKLIQPNPKKKQTHTHTLEKKRNPRNLLEAARQLGAPMDLTVDLAAAVDAWSVFFPEVDFLLGGCSFPHW